MVEKPFFACVCLQKRLVLRDKEETQREQQKALERLVAENGCKSSVILSGGCIMATGAAVHEAVGLAAVAFG